MPDIEAPDRYPPVGRCIYCVADQTPLGDEHIVPFALGGRIVLPKSSCRSCAHITGAIIERYCLRNMLGVVRYQRGFPSRHPKERPTKFKFTAITPFDKKEMEDDYRLHPHIFTMPMFDYPTILCDLPAGNKFNVKYHVMRSADDQHLKEIGARYPDVKEIFFRGEINMLMFSRMLAKIAYSFAVSVYGYEAIQSSPLRHLILEHRSALKFHHYIGGTFEQKIRTKNSLELRLERRLTLITATEFLVASIRIFPDLGAPQYYIAITPSAGIGDPPTEAILP